MRRLRARTLVDSCAVQVLTQVEIPGGVQDVWVTALTLSCRMQKPSRATMERFAGGQLNGKPDGDVAFAPATDIALTSRLVVTGVTETDVGDVGWTRTVAIIGDSGDTSVTVERVYPVRDL